MAARPYWSGQIRLSLVSLAVEIYSAVDSGRHISLHEIYRETGERVRHRKMVEDKPVDKDEIVKGYEYEKGEYVLIDPEEIQALKLPSKEVIDIVQFVDVGEIDLLYFEKPYFVVPDGKTAEEAFIVIRDALRESGKAGLGQLTIGGRERLCALRPCGNGMLLESLRYGDEVRESRSYFDDITEKKSEKEQLELAKELIKRKTAPFDPDRFHDHYHEALQELIDAKLEDRAPEYEEAPVTTGKVVNLMDALKQSLGDKAKDTKTEKPKAEKPGKTAAKKAPKRKEPAKKAEAKKPVRRKAG